MRSDASGQQSHGMPAAVYVQGSCTCIVAVQLVAVVHVRVLTMWSGV